VARWITVEIGISRAVASGNRPAREESCSH